MSKISPFKGIEACVFDAYGTLFDVGSAIKNFRDRLGPHADQISDLWRRKQLEYTWLRSLMGRHADFWQVTEDALSFACESFMLSDPKLRQELMLAYLQLDCYEEVAETLQVLKRRGLKTAILSNGSPAMLEAAVASARLSPWLDAVLSVEDVGVYKPSPRVYQLAIDRLGVGKRAISFQSSNAWDVAGAAAFGFQVAWVNRFGQPPEHLPSGSVVELRSLAELPHVLD